MSKAKIVFTRRSARGGATRRRGSSVTTARAAGSQSPAVLGPFDEGDRAVEVRLEVAPLLGVEPGEAVEVEVGDGRRRLVAVADRERRARDGPATPSARAAPRTNVVLPAPSSPETATTSPTREPRGEPGGERLRLRRRRRHELHGVRLEEPELDWLLDGRRRRRRGLLGRRGGPARGRARAAPGCGAKSSSSTCSIRGV